VGEGPDEPGVVGWLADQEVFQPGCQALQVLVACGQDARADQYLPDVVQGLGLRQVIEQVVGDRVPCPGQAAKQPGRPARAEPLHHGGRVDDRVERLEQGMELGGDVPAGAGEQDPGAFGQDAAEAAPAAVDLSTLPALAAGVIQPGSSGARTAERPLLLVAADQRPHHPAARAFSRATEPGSQLTVPRVTSRSSDFAWPPPSSLGARP
jgi:hypothetical protein